MVLLVVQAPQVKERAEQQHHHFTGKDCVDKHRAVCCTDAAGDREGRAGAAHSSDQTHPGVVAPPQGGSGVLSAAAAHGQLGMTIV